MHQYSRFEPFRRRNRRACRSGIPDVAQGRKRCPTLGGRPLYLLPHFPRPRPVTPPDTAPFYPVFRFRQKPPLSLCTAPVLRSLRQKSPSAHQKTNGDLARRSSPPLTPPGSAILPHSPVPQICIPPKPVRSHPRQRSGRHGRPGAKRVTVFKSTSGV